LCVGGIERNAGRVKPQKVLLIYVAVPTKVDNS
jgi:hypothetical protein